MKFKRKRLNNKGFTLIELLAVVVILALLMSISVTSVLNSMNNSRVSTLHSQTKSFVSWYSETVAEDELLDSSSKTIPVSGTSKIAQTANTDTWYCLDDNTSIGVNLAELYGLSDSNFVLSSNGGTAPTKGNISTYTVTKTTCSAIHTTSDNKVEVILVANSDGRFNVAKYQVTYAVSSADVGCTGAASDCA